MKRLLLAIGSLLAIMMLIALMLPLLVNKTAIVAKVTEIIKQSTGAEPVVMGDSSVSFFPTPKVTLNKVGIRNAPGAVTPYIMQLSSVDIYPAIADVFSSNPSIAKLVLQDPIFEIEKMQDDRLNWAIAFSNAKSTYQGLFKLSKVKSLALPDVYISNGLVNYRKGGRSAVRKYSAVQGTFLHDSQGMKLSVSGGYRNTPMNVDANIALTEESADSPFALQISAAGHKLELKGKLKQVAEDVEVEGNIEFKTDSIFDFAALVEGKDNTAKKDNGSPDNDGEASKHKLPIGISSAFHHTLSSYEWNDIQFVSDNVQAKASLTSKPEEKSSALNLSIEKLDIDALKESGLLSLLQKDKGADDKNEIGDSKAQESLIGLADDESMILDIKAKNIKVNNQVLPEASVEGEISGPFADISNAKITLPGNSQASLIGTVKQGFQGITYEGTLDAWGQDFTALMPLFTVDDKFFPQENFKRFKLRAEQVVLSPVEARFIEARIQIENMIGAGTVVANYGDKVKVESKIALAGFDVDKFIKQHQTTFAGTAEVPVYLKIPSEISAWLKTISSEHVTRLSLQKFVFNGQVRNRADIEILITPTKFNLSRLASEYNGTNFDFGLTVENIKGRELPQYKISLSADQLFIGTDTEAKDEQASGSANAEGGQAGGSSKQAFIRPTDWSKEEFDVSWLDNIDFGFDIRIKKLKYYSWLLQNFSAKGVAADRALVIDPLRANIWGADMAAKGNLTGGKLPIIGLAFTLNNIAVEQLTQVTPLFAGITGKFNIAGTISSSGISPYFMAENINGKVGLAGRDILVQGFNLRGIVRSVSAVRSVADILNVVRLAFPGGDTLVDTVQGNFVLNKGKAETIGIVLTTNESKGVVKSVLDLVKWKMDTEVGFELSTLDKQHPPTLKILFNGALENPKKGLDTKSLEEFVALKTKEKYLQDIPSLPQ